MVLVLGPGSQRHHLRGVEQTAAFGLRPRPVMGPGISTFTELFGDADTLPGLRATAPVGFFFCAQLLFSAGQDSNLTLAVLELKYTLASPGALVKTDF